MTDVASSRLSVADLAVRVSVPTARVERLAELGAIERGSDGRFDPGDVHRLRLIVAFDEAGVPLDALLAASRAERISLAYYDQLHPAPGPLSERTYAECVASFGDERAYLARLFAAFGLAEPAPETHLSIEDEALVTEMLHTVVETGDPDLALRAVRLFGDNIRRAADGALGAYGEAVERLGEPVQGLPVQEAFERLLRPWARFARRSSALAAWLAAQHLSRAIDAYSVTEAERILEEDGFVPARRAVDPAVAFVDLTGFTKLTEQQGDEIAASVALQLSDVTADIARQHGGRLIKLLGDGVLLRFDDASSALDAALALLDALPSAGLPSGHAGVESGPLINRDGDVFGRTVNAAARISDAAPDGRLYVTDRLAAALPAARFVLKRVGSVDLAGMGLTELVDVARIRSD